MGKYTHEGIAEVINLHSYSHFPSWIQNLSFGGLIQPSDKWLDQVSKMDKYFLKLHNDNFSFKKNIVRETTKYRVGKVNDVPKELITSFCRQRVFVRIKFLNIKKQKSKQKNEKLLLIFLENN